MRVAIFDRVDPPAPSRLPFRLAQTCSQGTATALLLFFIPATFALACASAMLLVHAATVPAARAIVAERPQLAVVLLLALVFWILLLGLPVKRLFGRWAVGRTVTFDAETVTVTDAGVFRSWTWSEPLSSFAGVAHHVRASLSATRHELILVHPCRKKSILLSLADNISQAEVDRVATLLGHEEIPPQELYRLGVLWPRWSLPVWRRPAHA